MMGYNTNRVVVEQIRVGWKNQGPAYMHVGRVEIQDEGNWVMVGEHQYGDSMDIAMANTLEYARNSLGYFRD